MGYISEDRDLQFPHSSPSLSLLKFIVYFHQNNVILYGYNKLYMYLKFEISLSFSFSHVHGKAYIGLFLVGPRVGAQ
jgi:hypothetical protein